MGDRRFRFAQTSFSDHLFLAKTLLCVEKDRTFDTATALRILKLDIQSAFDRAWHPAIIANLIDKGMPPLYVHLIANYLTNRTISVSYGGGTAAKTLTLHSTRRRALPLPLEPFHRHPPTRHRENLSRCPNILYGLMM